MESGTQGNAKVSQEHDNKQQHMLALAHTHMAFGVLEASRVGARAREREELTALLPSTTNRGNKKELV